jgi:hypothetical protein
VENWEPTTEENASLKDYAIDQLKSSIDWDCKVYEPPTKHTAEEWLQGRIEATESSLAFYKKQKEAEIKRVNESNKWVTELVESIFDFHHQGLPELKFESLEAPKEAK